MVPYNKHTNSIINTIFNCHKAINIINLQSLIENEFEALGTDLLQSTVLLKEMNQN